MTLEKLVRPDLPEAHTPQAQQGLISGFIPAILNRVESSQDPEGLGRIKVQCDLLASNQTLPNSWDGWVWVGANFTVNGGQGGDHRPLNSGTQIALIPMFGNPKQLLMLCALHSRVDRPNPIFDRTIEVSGSQSAGQVFKIEDDRNIEETIAFPHGVTSQVTRTGDKIDQTQEGARNHLQKDGTNRVENNKSSIVQSKNGDITQRSAGDATQVLTRDGVAIVKTEVSKNELRLDGKTSQLLGPAPELTRLLNKAKKNLGGQLGQAQELLKTLELTKNLLPTEGAKSTTLTDLATSVSETLGKLADGIGSTLQTGIDTLKEIQKLPAIELGLTLFDQIESVVASGSGSLFTSLKEALVQKPDIQEINRFLKASGVAHLIPLEETTTNINAIKGLGHSLNLQAEFILSKVLPGGYDSFKNLSAIGVADKVESISELFEEAKTILSSEAPLLPESVKPVEQQQKERQQRLEVIPQQIRGLLPKELQSFASPAKLKSLVNKGDFEAGISGMMGSIAKGINGQAISRLTKALPFSNALPDIQKLTDAIAKRELENLSQLLSSVTKLPGLEGLGTLTKNLPEMLSQVLSALTEQFGKILQDAQKRIAQLMNIINEQAPRAKVEIDKLTSELRAKLGKHRVYASEKGVGAVTPWGGFDFGRDGSLMKSLGKMVMQVVGEGAGGITLDPKKGASVQGFDKKGETLSSVTAKGGNVAIEALGGASIFSGGNSLQVNPEGVFFNDINLQVLLALPNQITALQTQLTQANDLIAGLLARIEALESGQPTPPSTS